MGTMASPSVMSLHKDASTYDELSMRQSLLFSDSLKDLKNLRAQLYSAAEYFELSYTDDDQKHIVVNTLKDYAIQALVNTIDHLGSVTFKVNGLLDEQVDEVSETELRVSCIEQRLRTCQEYSNCEGISQQSLVITTPKYHKRYILPVEESINGPGYGVKSYQGFDLDDEDYDWHQLRSGKHVRSHLLQDVEHFSLQRKGQSPQHLVPVHSVAQDHFRVDPLLQTLLAGDIHKNLRNQHHPASLQREMAGKSLSITQAKASAFLRPCLAGAGHQIKTRCYIVTWMNIEEEVQRKQTNQKGSLPFSFSPFCFTLFSSLGFLFQRPCDNICYVPWMITSTTYCNNILLFQGKCTQLHDCNVT